MFFPKFVKIMHNCFCRDYGGFVQRLWNPPHKLAEVYGVFRLIEWLDNTRRYELTDCSGDLIGGNCLAEKSSPAILATLALLEGGH